MNSILVIGWEKENKEKSMIHPQLGQNHRLLFLKDPK